LFLILGGLSLPLAASTVIGLKTERPGAMGFSMWYMGPMLATLWGFLSLTTQLVTSLLVLELIGVVLVWSLSCTNPSLPLDPAKVGRAPGLIYALVIFVWASGISALTLLMGVGLTGLEGGLVNFPNSSSLTCQENLPTRGGEVFFTTVLLFKFLMGGGQFLLLAWYRFLPSNGLIFYLFFYYPAHLVVGTTFFLGLFISPASSALGVVLASLVIAAAALLPHLGSQTSPTLTLAGSSFVGLSFLALALFNLLG